MKTLVNHSTQGALVEVDEGYVPVTEVQLVLVEADAEAKRGQDGGLWCHLKQRTESFLFFAEPVELRNLAKRLIQCADDAEALAERLRGTQPKES